jgi:uncharacterized protein (DUF1330 family)
VSAYVIAEIEVADPAGMETYRRAAAPILEHHGGRLLAAGPVIEVFEGAAHPTVIAMLEFPDVETARRWYNSDDYTAARAIRKQSGNSAVALFAPAWHRDE